MSRTRWLYLVLWIALLLKLFFFSPQEHPRLGQYLLELALFQGNPLEVALFQAMGLWPLAYARWLWRERGFPPAWPFVVGSFALGAFAMMPYLVFKPSDESAPRRKPDSRSGLALVGAAAVLGLWGLVAGDYSAFVESFRTVKFVHVMSFDFISLAIAYPVMRKSRS